MFDGLAIGENRGKSRHAAPNAKQKKLESNEEDDEKDRRDQVKSVDGQNIAEACDGNGLSVQDEPRVAGRCNAENEQRANREH